MDMMGIRRAVLMNVDKLPPGYLEYDYLQAYGSRTYIDTGVAGNDNTIQIDFSIKSMAKGNYVGLTGSHETEQKSCWRVIQGASSTLNAFNITVNNRRSSASPQIKITALDTIVDHKIRLHLEYGSGYAEYDGIRYSATSTEDGSEVSAQNIYIGKAGGHYSDTSSSLQHKWYRYQIRKQGKLVRDYRPCVRLKDNKVGYYDMINYTFNPSIGPEDFVAGND